MPGGSLHWPLWVPYALYGEVDHLYGLKHWELQTGFAGAQSLMNVVESLMYLGYVWMWYRYGKEVVPGARRAVAGREGAITVLLGFSAAVMTVSKTVLYCELSLVLGWDGVADLCRAERVLYRVRQHWPEHGLEVVLAVDHSQVSFFSWFMIRC